MDSSVLLFIWKFQEFQLVFMIAFFQVATIVFQLMSRCAFQNQVNFFLPHSNNFVKLVFFNKTIENSLRWYCCNTKNNSNWIFYLVFMNSCNFDWFVKVFLSVYLLPQSGKSTKTGLKKRWIHHHYFVRMGFASITWR